MKSIPITWDEDGLDPALAEGLLAGSIAVDEVPGEWQALAGLLATARGPSTVAEQVGEREAIGTFMVAADRRRVRSSARRSERGLRVRVGILAVAGVASLSLSGALAAAADVLPPGAQAVVASAMAHVGMSLPRPARQPVQPRTTRGSVTSAASGSEPAVTGAGDPSGAAPGDASAASSAAATEEAGTELAPVAESPSAPANAAEPPVSLPAQAAAQDPGTSPGSVVTTAPGSNKGPGQGNGAGQGNGQGLGRDHGQGAVGAAGSPPSSSGPASGTTPTATSTPPSSAVTGP